MSIGGLHIGTSGWSYDEWRDEFYEGVPKKQWLEAYTERFDTVESNATFYRLQSEKTLRRWAERTPDEFVFAAKGNRYVTHTKMLADADETVPRSRDNLAPLAHKVGAVLWQMPARFQRGFDRLRGFCEVLAREWSEMRHALEFRHPSWFSDDVAALLSSHNLANCQSDAPKWPMWEALTTDLVYIRLHGHTRLYASRYSAALLDRWATRIHKWLAEGCEVYVYFDNTAEGAAPEDARRLLEKLRE